MRKVDPNDLRRNIAIQLTVQAKWAKTALQLSTGHRAVDTVSQNIMDTCLAGCVVLAPDMVGAGHWGQRPGRFGVDEPWPFEAGHKPPVDVPPPPAPPRRSDQE